MSLGRGEGGTGEKEEGVEKVSRCFFTVVVPLPSLFQMRNAVWMLWLEKGGGEEKDLGDKFDYARLLTAVSHTQN